MNLATVLDATQPVLQLVDRRLERGVEAVGAGLRSGYRTPAAGGDLDALTGFALPPVGCVLELDIEKVDGAIEPLEAGEFLRDVQTVMIGDFYVAALEYNIGGGCRWGLIVSDGRFVQHRIGIHG